MAKVEMVFHIIESGSNSMSTYQAIQSAAKSPNDALSLFQNGSSLIATVSNVAPMLQPIRIMTNGLAATSALMRIVTDWQDPNKKVQPGDVLTSHCSYGQRLGRAPQRLLGRSLWLRTFKRTFSRT
jgi:hypothetical protein